MASGIGFIAVAAFFWAAGRDLEGVGSIFPRALELFLALGGVLLILSGLRRKRMGREGDAEEIHRDRVAAITGSSVAYVAGIPLVGFYASSAVFLFVVSWVLSGRGKGAGGLVKPACFTLIMVSMVYLVFQYLLGVPTPRGFLL
jgi:hypothetical protein